MTPADDVALGRMFFRLSPEPVDRRVRARAARTALRYLACVDHDRREAVVAECDGEIVGVARYDCLEDRLEEAEVAVVVEARWQRSGVGHRLMRRLAGLATARGVVAFRAEVLGGNREAIDLVRSLAPTAEISFSSGEVVVRASLPGATAA